MRVHRLRVKDFKGLGEVCLDIPAAGVTVIEGKNEAGKTSLIEAIALLLDPDTKASSGAVRVKEAQPVGSDAASEIEADIDFGDTWLTFFKRYHRRTATQLSIHRPESRTLDGDEAHNEFHRIFAHARDRTLWDALQVAQAANLEQPALDRSIALRTALDTAAGQEDSDERSNSNLAARIEREYTQYYTPRAGKETGELAAARKTERDSKERAADLHRQVDDLDATVQRIENLEAEYRDLEIRLGPARQEAEAAREALAEVERMERAVGEHENAVETARAKQDNLERQHRNRTDLAGRLQKLRDELESAEASRAELAPQIEAREADLARATAACATAETRLEAIVQARARARDDERLLRINREVAQMDRRLGEILALQQETEQARARLEQLTVDSETATGLRTLANSVEAARQQSRTGAPHLAIQALANVDVAVDGDQLHLNPGGSQELHAEHPLTIRIADLAEVRITPPPSSAEAARTLQGREAELQQALTSAGVGSIEEAEEQAAEWHQLKARRGQITERVRELLEDLDRLSALREKRERDEARARELRQHVPEGYTLPASISESEARLAEAERDEGTCRTAYEKARRTEDDARKALAALTDQVRNTDARLEIRRPQLEEAEAQLQQEREQLDDATLEQQLAAARTALADAQEQLQDERSRLAAAGPASVRNRERTARESLGRIEADLARKNEALARERGALDSHATDGLFERAEDAAAEAEYAARELARLERKAAAARMLHETMQRKRAEAQQRYTGPLAAAIQELGAALYGAGFQVELGSDLSIARRTLDGTTLAFHQLSGGAKEQLAILARLATARLVDPSNGVPLIIDDALGYTDPDRLARMGDVLRLAGEHTQVIVLTCSPDRYEHVQGAHILRI